jgi:hypothetical protein
VHFFRLLVGDDFVALEFFHPRLALMGLINAYEGQAAEDDQGGMEAIVASGGIEGALIDVPEPERIWHDAILGVGGRLRRLE